jgi:hypothetical protein
MWVKLTYIELVFLEDGYLAMSFKVLLRVWKSYAVTGIQQLSFYGWRESATCVDLYFAFFTSV